MNTDQLETFWNEKNYKIYVVWLRCASGKRKPETRYIRVTADKNTHEARLKAVRCAVTNSIDFANGKNINYSVRLAHPVSDLGCVQSNSKDLNLAA